VHPFFDLELPIVLGHRGCAGEAPENTLPSFERALATGAAILESDVHLTRDGVPVLIHDEAVDRTTQGRGAVRELSLAELQRLDAGHRFSPDAGRSHPYRGRGVRVPTLEQALAALPGARFNLELKEDVPGMVEETLAVLRAAGREELTLLTAERDGLMARLRAELARGGAGVAQGASAGDVLAFVRAALDGVPPAPGPQALQVPANHDGRPLVTREFVAHAHAHGLQVHVWTIDEPAEMHALLDLGVDGLVTDFPGRMLGVIAERRARAARTRS
jgi:glycerophosphoryl diester phosphodiesterase